MSANQINDSKVRRAKIDRKKLEIATNPHNQCMFTYIKKRGERKEGDKCPYVRFHRYTNFCEIHSKRKQVESIDNTVAIPVTNDAIPVDNNISETMLENEFEDKILKDAEIWFAKIKCVSTVSPHTRKFVNCTHNDCLGNGKVQGTFDLEIFKRKLRKSRTFGIIENDDIKMPAKVRTSIKETFVEDMKNMYLYKNLTGDLDDDFDVESF